MEKRFKNLTYHEIAFMTQKGELISIPPSGQIARVEYTPEVIDMVGDVPVIKISYKEPVGLPEPEEGVYYIVSATVKNAVGESRPDVVAAYSVERVAGTPTHAKGVRING
jgi:hypothetical protein